MTLPDGRSRLRFALEIAIGLVPVTLVLLPFLAAGAGGLIVSVFATLADPEWPLSTRARMVLPTFGLLAWVAAAFAGVLAVWVMTLSIWGWRLRGKTIRVVVLLAFVAGIVAEGRWIATMLRPRHAYDAGTWFVWLAFLIPPTVLGLLHLPEFVRESK